MVQPINGRKIYYKGLGMDGSLGSYETVDESYETIDNLVESESSSSSTSDEGVAGGEMKQMRAPQAASSLWPPQG